ncbi:hypothetical protein BDV38DRAFT_204900 [Aspergillus pseudotamarii]|uniref:Zn(2)-C6 fungal-type domain-containing protein n=1 Tax=Aspergillus pseudotamarii TaxID=132259 RepID=A0A5N6T587_ASPPS|nr:uncharacterized protein BDV38DRAFT_204900 [Aspergillus pseudotamarii]KAE8141409.1 hypothetical protein BDV38DRAFT_204900 [Aspergillus pseudotamarii]
MGYSGKPSSACGPCRARRAKCDRKHPHCTQCARKCIPCSGYRDLSGLVIRDETQTVAQKARRRPRTGPQYSSPALIGPNGSGLRIRHTPEYNSFNNNESCISTAEFVSVPRSLAQPLEEVANAFFVNIYLPTSRFSFLLDHYYTFINAQPIPPAIQAVAFAYLHVERPSQAVNRAAHRSYCTAIAETNSALSNPSMARLDSTLISVLLLGLFESLIFRDRYSVSSWAAHSHGAWALLRLRGCRQLNSPEGRSLLSHISTNIRSICLLGSKPVPCDLLRLESDNCFPERDSNRAFHINDILMNQLPQMLSAMRKPITSTTACLGLIKDVKEFEEQLVQICPGLESCISSYQNGFTRGTSNRKAIKTWLIVQMLRWSLSKTLRMKLLSLVAKSDTFGIDVSYFTQELEIIHKKVKDITSDVLKAVPQLLNPSMEGAAMSGRYTLWLLAELANAESCPEARRTYILHQLRNLKVRYNLQPAEEAAKMSERTISLERWLLLCLLS